MGLFVLPLLCVRACVRVCVRACVRASVRACERAGERVCTPGSGVRGVVQRMQFLFWGVVHVRLKKKTVVVILCARACVH